jgi:hypothetical protein
MGVVEESRPSSAAHGVPNAQTGTDHGFDRGRAKETTQRDGLQVRLNEAEVGRRQIRQGRAPDRRPVKWGALAA